MRLLLFSLFSLTVFCSCNNSTKPSTGGDPYGIKKRELERAVQDKWEQRQFEMKLEEAARKERMYREIDSIKKLPPKVVTEEPCTPDDAYEIGYEKGYSVGYDDGRRGYSHGSNYNEDDDNDFYNYYYTRYCEGYDEGYDDGYEEGNREYELEEDD